MKKYIIFYLSALLLFLYACTKKDYKKPLTVEKYTDSTYAVRTDSLTLDSLNPTLNGYFKLYGYGGIDSFEKGELKKGVKTGKWQRYFYGKELSELVNYDQNGNLNGEYIEYFINGIPKSKFYYHNNQPLGEQKEYDENGNLALRYYKDSADDYTQEYLALNTQGDTLYYTQIPKKGNGYLKLYDNQRRVLKEGKIVNQQFRDTVKEYEYPNDKYTDMSFYLYTPDSIARFIKKIKVEKAN